MQTIQINHQPVALFKVLKVAGLANSGGEAKMLIAEGLVAVNGETDTRKRRKINHGDVITVADQQLEVVFEGSD